MEITVEEFKNECLKKSPEIIVQQYLIEGHSYFFEKFYNLEEEYNFKKKLSQSLNIHIRDIVIVGSSKLGFSMKPEEESPGLYLFKEFDFCYKKTPEEEKSDIDVAIISGSVFDLHLLNLYEFTKSYSDTTSFYGKLNSFAKYIVKGWLRPDKLPAGYNVLETINDLRTNLKSKYGRKVNFGIYKSWHYFETYHKNNINTLKINLEYNK